MSLQVVGALASSKVEFEFELVAPARAPRERCNGRLNQLELRCELE